MFRLPIPNIRSFQSRISIFRPLNRSISNSIRSQFQHTSFYKQESLQDLILSKNLALKNDDELLRCTIFDINGNPTAISEDFKKNELFSKHLLLPRDLRKIDKGKSDIVPSILIRPNSILVNLLHIRALVKADCIILFDSYGSTDSHTQYLFLHDLEGRLKSTLQESGLPYEIRALEAIFISVVANLDAELKVHNTVIKNILHELDTHIDRAKLRYLLIQSKKITTFHQKATLIRNIVDEILDQDDELNGLYLTEKMNGTPRKRTDHAEVEMLLESYYKHCDEIVQTTENIISNIRTTEEIINIILDSNRNELMFLSLKFSIGLLSLGIGLYIAAVYGMNLENFIEETNSGFEIVVGVSMIAVILLSLYSVKRLNRLQRVTMTGDDLRSPLSNSHLKDKKDSSS